jgi:phosphohistidine phosphatase
MDIILWRHAEAQEGGFDLERELTVKGRKQALKVAGWLTVRLPKGFRAVSSPAERAKQTAAALTGDVEVVPALAPGVRPETLLAALGWPKGEGTVVFAGHQPDIGRAVTKALTGRAEDLSVPKAGLWWLRSRDRGRGAEAQVVAVVTPDTV